MKAAIVATGQLSVVRDIGRGSPDGGSGLVFGGWVLWINLDCEAASRLKVGGKRGRGVPSAEEQCGRLVTGIHVSEGRLLCFFGHGSCKG